MKITKLSSVAQKCGLREGDEIVEMGGYPFTDIIDYLYFDNERKFDAVVVRDGKKHTVRISKKDGQSLGLEFDKDLDIIRCKNKCVFCFVDQLPKGLRSTLYVKDDDYRMSFICGSYVTMTNVSEEEIQRIIRLKLSPLYISVHVFDDDLRVKMVRNPHTRDLIPMMRRFGAAGIKMHTQLVIVPEMNDGEKLVESIRGLHAVEGVESVAVVPVGLTGHRSGLSDIRTVNKQEAERAIDDVEKLNEEYGGYFCWCSDEYYMIAEREIPNFAYYGDFGQIENGVGLIADFEDNLDYSLECMEKKNLKGKATFITGTSFAPILETLKKSVEEKLGIDIAVKGIRNDFFGNSVTVAGLVVGSDIIAQANVPDTDCYVIPDNMLREFTTTFLDDTTLDEVEKALGKPVLTVTHNGSNLAEVLSDFFEHKRNI